MLNLKHSKIELFIVSVVFAISFGIYETCFRQITLALDLNDTHHKYTTWEQFIISMMWTLMLLKHKQIKYKWIRYLTYPFNIYLCELLCGGLLLLFNIRAWEYKDSYTLFNGLISFSFYPLWFVLQFFEDMVYEKTMEFIGKLMRM